MKDFKFSIQYKIDGVLYEESLRQTAHYVIESEGEEDRLSVVLHPKQEMELVDVKISYPKEYGEGDCFFANGYQSWTTSTEYRHFQVQKNHNKIVNGIPIAKHLAELSGDYAICKYSEKPGQFHGFTYGYIRRGEDVELYGSLSERNGFTILEADMKGGTLTIRKDVEGVIVKEPYELYRMVRFVGNYDAVFDNYFKALALPKPRVDHLAGYTSWYNYFTKINEEIILRDLEGMKRAGESANIFQVDDGYETAVGDWLEPSPKFPRGMKFIAEEIHAAGYLAGLWMAPFNAGRNSKVAKEHPDWLLKGKNGKPVLSSTVGNGSYTLNIDIPEVREHIRKFFDVVLNDWGYDMLKLDFLYSQCTQPRTGRSRGQIMCEAMEFLRECVGDKIILGCGVPLGPAFGYVDACRIGCDVDLKYTGRFYTKMRFCHEIPSAQNSILNAVFRRHLSRRAFASDPDVFFLRKENLTFTEEQKEILYTINHLFGDILFVSDNAAEYDEQTLEILKRTFLKSNAIVLSAELSAEGVMQIVYLDNDKKSRLKFNLKKGIKY